MQNMHKIQIACLLFFMGLCNQNLKAQEITLYGIHFPPHVIDSTIISKPSFIDTNKSVYGIDADLVREAYATQGVVVNFEIMSWRRIMRDVQDGMILGAITCRKVSPRAQFSIFSENITLSAHALVTRKQLLDDQVISLATLIDYKTVAVEGWSQTNVLKDAEIPFSIVSNLRQGLNVVLRRDQDVLVAERDNALFTANKIGIQDQLSFYDLTVDESNYYPVCFSKEYPNAEKWRDILNKGLEVIKLNGVQERIFQRYGIFYDSMNQSFVAKE